MQMGKLEQLWEQRLSGVISRDEFRFYSSFESAESLDFCGFLERAGAQELTFSREGARIVLDDGSKFVWDPRQIGSAPNLVLLESTYEPQEIAVLMNLSAKSSLFVDVGANVGYFTIRLALANSQLKGIAVEAVPSTASILSANLHLNNLQSRVTVVNKALGASDGACDLYVPEITGHTAASLRDLHPLEGSTVIAVPKMTLDGLLSDSLLTCNDLLKLDVEGAELEVAMGGRRTLENGRPIVFAELLRKWMKEFGTHPNEFLRLMKTLDYHCLQFSQRGLEPLTEVTEETQSTNFLFVQDEVLRQLRKDGYFV